MDSAISLFPELKLTDFHQEMRTIAHVSFDKALKVVESAIFSLRSACRLNCCRKDGPDKVASCVLAMSISIQAMVLTISCIERDPELLPTIRGILCVYNDQANQIAASKLSGNPDASLLSIALGLKIEGVPWKDDD